MDETPDISGIPPDLRAALEGWWRAHHHGTRQEERDAEETLCEAINPLIEAIRADLYPTASRAAG